jgi:hypothetical protein
LGVINGHHQKGLVDIRRKDMTLLREIDALADNIIPSVLNLCNEHPSRWSPLPFGEAQGEVYPVSHSDGVRAANAFQTEIPFDFTIKQLVIVRQDGVPATSILNN